MWLYLIFLRKSLSIVTYFHLFANLISNFVKLLFTCWDICFSPCFDNRFFFTFSFFLRNLINLGRVWVLFSYATSMINLGESNLHFLFIMKINLIIDFSFFFTVSWIFQRSDYFRKSMYKL